MPSLADNPHLLDLLGLAIATACGLLIGLERESRPDDAQPDGERVGVRTLALVGLFGGLGGVLARPFGGWAVLATMGATVILLIGARRGRVRDGEGITTEFAALAVASMGLLSTVAVEGLDHRARWILVAAAAVATLLLLSTRNPLHRLAAHISVSDLYTTGRLGVLLVIVLPLLPREQVGPIPGLVPFEVGLMVSLIMAIGFVAYIGIRLRGPRQGLILAGGLGGLASSTAVTLEFARRTRRRPALAGPAAAGIVLAAAAMVPRQLIEVAVVAPGLLGRAAIPLGAMGAAALVAAFITARLGAGDGAPDTTDASEAVDNPSSLGSALKFGGIFVLVVTLTEYARTHYGETGLHISALVGGLTDADAITLAVGRMWGAGDIEPDPAVLALVIGAGSNTLVKAAIGGLIGGLGLGLRLLAALAPAVALGIGLALLV